MGLYYNPIPPHIGAQQPLTPKKITPPISGPPPQNPPFMGGDSIHEATLVCWQAWGAARNFTPEPNFKPDVFAPWTVNATRPNADRIHPATLIAWQRPAYMPIVGAILDPPISGPPPQDPPFAGGDRMNPATQIAWMPRPPTPHPDFLPVNLAPLLAPPPVVTYVPPGDRMNPATIIAWQRQAPMPITGAVLDPPISGPDNPPFAGGDRMHPATQVAWWPRPFTSHPDFVPNNFAPLLPAPVVTYVPPGDRMNPATMISWWPRPPMPLVGRLRNPPQSGPAPQNPPRIGARIPLAVQVAWIPPPPHPPAVRNRGIETPPVTGILAANELPDTVSIIVEVRGDAPGILNFGRRVTINRW